MPVADYDEKRQARIDRLSRQAQRARGEAELADKKAHAIMDSIPLGQPILLGHHSERHARSDAAKIDRNLYKAWDLSKEADELDRRARAAENNTAIFSDNPAAGELLEEKLARLKKRREVMKAANRLVKKGDRAGLAELGYSERLIDQLFTPPYPNGSIGYPAFTIANLGATIRGVEKRLEEIEKHAGDVTSEVMVGGVRIRDDVDENRIQVFYPNRPSDATITAFKRAGFHFSHTFGCWQRLRKDGVFQYAQRLVKSTEEVSPFGETPRSAETEP